jgi:nitrate/nitrite transporter NarK
MLGNLSGFVAPYMVGVIIQATDSYRLALAALGVQSALGGLLLFAWYAARHRQRQAELAAPAAGQLSRSHESQ